MTGTPSNRPQKPRNAVVAGVCVAVVAGMVGMAYAAVPLYRIFCQVTGYNGTTQVAAAGPSAVIDREIKIQFDANISSDLSWRFQPEQRELRLRVGETALAFYRAESHAANRTWGTAVFNVTPLEAGQYFNKIDCFCFTEQSLEPGETADMPVSFFVDPAIDEDEDLAHVTTITLSYTFYPMDGDEEAERDTASAPVGTASTLN